MGELYNKRDTVDILEDRIPRELLTLLLKDHTTGNNILWATDIGHNEKDSIMLADIIGKNGLVLRPRVRKSEEEKKIRTKKRAEVFTPSYICNEQLNAADFLWFFGKTSPVSGSPFNKVSGREWKSTTLNSIKKVFEKTGKNWMQYVLEDKIEMCCGEGPYLTSRYDVVTEREIPVSERIGILDRKLRVVNAFVGAGTNCSKAEWLNWVLKAYQHTYGFEWQGDNLLLTREAMLFTFIDNLKDYNLATAIVKQEKQKPFEAKDFVLGLDLDFLNIDDFEYLKAVCEILSWNIWQMDGLSGCTPYVIPTIDFKKLIININKNNGEGLFQEQSYKIPSEFCRIMDWNENRVTTYAEVFAEAIKSKTV